MHKSMLICINQLCIFSILILFAPMPKKDESISVSLNLTLTESAPSQTTITLSTLCASSRESPVER